jgi:hypothetical protein
MMKASIKIIALCMILTACDEEGEMKIVDEQIDEAEFMQEAMGTFIDLKTGHALMGDVAFLSNASGEKILRFEDFSVVNGPDVNVYLSKTSEFKDVIDLGDLKATQGNINYALDASVNTQEYKYVLVWCVKYAVLFGYAEVK